MLSCYIVAIHKLIFVKILGRELSYFRVHTILDVEQKHGNTTPLKTLE
jgi:hypothetical protein